MKLPYILAPAAVLTVLVLGACEPIQIDVIFENHNTYVNSTPDGGPPDKVGGDSGLPPIEPVDAGQSDGGPPPDASCVDGWRSREVTTEAQNVAFAFDSKGVGQLAMTKAGRVFVGGLREGDVLTRAGELQGYVGGFALDAEGGRHVVVSNASAHTVYAHDREGIWRSTVLFPGYPVALAIAPSGSAHVILNQGTGSEQHLAHATNQSGQWVLTDLGIKSRNSRADLAVDARGHAHIAWHADSSYGIYYATNASGTWMQELVADQTGNEPVLAIDPLGRPHLIYSFGGSYAEHAVKEDGGWRLTGVGASSGIALDLMADARGNLHALLDRYTNPKVVLASLPAGSRSWSYTPIISLDGKGGVTHPWEFALGLGPSGEPRIAYWYAISTDGAGLGNSVRYAEPCP
ncbi:hypothetical protein [Archangium lipolyticum]|uniref:hypothetical protein n=1 Tax=Archangium lipolyticum TaxID=2970465 RepID=UPI00214A8AC4|nr:hypothetical protein [Archangium lipolyticum]